MSSTVSLIQTWQDWTQKKWKSGLDRKSHKNNMKNIYVLGGNKYLNCCKRYKNFILRTQIDQYLPILLYPLSFVLTPKIAKYKETLLQQNYLQTTHSADGKLWVRVHIKILQLPIFNTFSGPSGSLDTGLARLYFTIFCNIDNSDTTKWPRSNYFENIFCSFSL